MSSKLPPLPIYYNDELQVGLTLIPIFVRW